MSLLFFYKIMFVIEILVGESIFAVHLRRRRFFWLRFCLSIGVILLAAVFFPLPPKICDTAWYSCLLFLSLASLTFLYLFLCYETRFTYAFFSLLASYTFQQLGYMVYTLTTSLLSGLLSVGNMYSSDPFDFSSLTGQSVIVILIYLDSFVLAFGTEYFLFRKELKDIECLKLRFNSLFALALLLFSVDVILNAIVTYQDDPRLRLNVIYLYNMISCGLIVYIQRQLIKTMNIARENALMSEALIRAEKQYETQKETIGLINIKCHDLKHQIAQLGGQQCVSSESIKEINSLIKIYDSSIVTTNEVLNIILTEKSLVCSSSNIRLTSMIDADKLSLLQKGDIYSLFGNILDNAIEASKSLSDPEKRCIGLNIHTVNSFLLIQCENYYTGDIVFHDNLPVTKKTDTAYHGFGMKSIQAITNKYDGNLHIDTANGIFRITITFPINE